MTTSASAENNPLPAAFETRFAALIFTDIVGSTELKARHGVPAYSAALRVHNDHFERIARECHGIRILQNMGDGYFAEAGSVAEAVRFALLFQDAMRAGPWGEIRLTTRVGIHAGEVTALVAEGGSGIVAPAADLAARVMSLAVGGQILLTRFPFDETRHFVREHPAVTGKDAPPLRWLAHGPYLLKGRDEPMEIFEVGAEGLAPLIPPPDGEKAKRAIRPGEEETLGWRPAIGLEIPGRAGWRLTALLGKGGFGEVWTGEHAKLRQRRAFKFCFDDERLRALKREVTLVRLLRTALGDRDDIVRFHELKLDEPPFYLESDLAPHGNLLQWAEKQGGLAAIPLAQRIALVAHTATALAAAHSIGVLHKDIKPTNILIFDAPDGSVRPRLVDFGIGTLADSAVLSQHGVTAAGFTRATTMHSTGTPTYSPPEYLAGKPYTVQGDIYGLGVLLYQLITADTSRPIAPGWERDITDPLLREGIAACVDGDPARRLPSAADLADRLFHLEQRRTEIAEKERLTREASAHAEAEAATAAARLRVKRLRKVAGAFAVLALLAFAGGVFAWINQCKADAARAEVTQKKAEVDRRNVEYRAMLVEAGRSDRLMAEEKLRAGQEQWAFALLARACEYDPASTLAAEKGIAALSTWYQFFPTVILSGPGEAVSSVQFSPNGAHIATVSAVPEDKTARVWDAATGKMLATLAGHTAGVSSVQFSPDGSRIVTASSDKTARIWDAASHQTLATLTGHEGVVSSAQFSRDGVRVVTASDDKTARVWDAATGKMLVTLAGHEAEVPGAQFSPDGTRMVTVSRDRTARVWDATTGKMLANLAEPKAAMEIVYAGMSGVLSAQFSPDGRHIVTALDDKRGTVRLWDVATGKMLATLDDSSLPVLSVHFSPDGARIVTASWGGARVWDAATGKTLATLDGHEGPVRNAYFNTDGRRIITAAVDVRVWDTATGKILAMLPKPEARSAQFSPDGTRIVTVSWGRTARVWEAATDKRRATLAGHKARLSRVRFNPDGTRIVTVSHDLTARMWEADNGKMLTTLSAQEAEVLNAPTDIDHKRYIEMGGTTVWVRDAATGKRLVALSGHGSGVSSAQFSPDGTRIVTASRDKTARVWDAATGKILATLRGHEKTVISAEFSPDGTRIVTASEDQTARVWEAASGKTLGTLANKAGVGSAQFSPDGKRILTTSWNQTVHVWDAAIGKKLVAFSGREGRGFSPELAELSAQFNPDGSRIVTTSWEDTKARVWDSSTGKIVATLAHEAGVLSAEFSSDGTRIVTALDDTTAHVWDVLPPSAGPPPEWFPDFLRYMAQMRLNPDGELETLKAEDWLALRERLRGVLRASANADTPYLRILRKYVRE